MEHLQRRLYGAHEVPPEVHRVVASPEVARLPRETQVPEAGWGFILIYALAYAGVWLALLTPIMVTLALRIRQLEPENAAGRLSLVLAVGALFALLPDQVPQARRGTVAGILCICTPAGQVGGAYLTQAVAGPMTAMFMVPAGVGIAAVILLALFLRDRRIEPHGLAPLAAVAIMPIRSVR